MDGSLPGSAIDSTYGIDSFFGFLDSLWIDVTDAGSISDPSANGASYVLSTYYHCNYNPSWFNFTQRFQPS